MEATMLTHNIFVMLNSIEIILALFAAGCPKACDGCSVTATGWTLSSCSPRHIIFSWTRL